MTHQRYKDEYDSWRGRGSGPLRQLPGERASLSCENSVKFCGGTHVRSVSFLWVCDSQGPIRSRSLYFTFSNSFKIFICVFYPLLGHPVSFPMCSVTGEPVFMFHLSLVTPVFPQILCFVISLRSPRVKKKMQFCSLSGHCCCCC